MAFTDTETLRVQAIESKINTIQTAANNLATRKEVKNLFAILDQIVRQLQIDIEQLELTGSGGALAAHKIDPDAHTQLNERYYLKSEFISISVGVADAGKPVELNASGVIDSSMVGAVVTDHGDLTGLSDDDHSQYHTDARALAWLGTRSTTDLPEGDNLYYTVERVTTSGLLTHDKLAELGDDDHTQYHNDSRAAAWLTTKTTTDLVEGNNLYYTEARVTANTTVQSGVLSVHDRSHGVDSASDHAAAVTADWGKYIRANPTTGAIEFVELDVSADHGDLTGLEDDDHTQYLLLEGRGALQSIVGTVSVRASGGASGTEQFGETASAVSSNSTAVGSGARAGLGSGSTGCTAIGQAASAGGTAASTDAVAIGRTATASRDRNLAVGTGATADGTVATAIGSSSFAGFTAGGNGTVALGYNANASGQDSTSIGSATVANASQCTAIGSQSDARAANSTAVGVTANAGSGSAASTGATAIGHGAIAGSVASVTDATAIGRATIANAVNSTALGATASAGAGASSTGSIAIGQGAISGSTASRTDGISIGRAGTVNGSSSIGIGASTTLTANNSIYINSGTTGKTVSQPAILIGYTSQNVTGTGCTYVGRNINNLPAGTNITAIGDAATAGASGSTVVGAAAGSSFADCTVVGAGTSGNAVRTVVVGRSAVAAGTESIAIGYNTSIGFANSLAIGADATVTAANQGQFGTSAKPIDFVLYGTIVGAKVVVSAKTTAYPVVTLNSRTCFTNEGSAGEVNFTLPTAVAGLTYTFHCLVAQILRITAAAGDTIRVTVNVTPAAGNIEMDTIGSSVTLLAVNATEWVATSALGTVTVNT